REPSSSPSAPPWCSTRNCSCVRTTAPTPTSCSTGTRTCWPSTKATWSSRATRASWKSRPRRRSSRNARSRRVCRTASISKCSTGSGPKRKSSIASGLAARVVGMRGPVGLVARDGAAGARVHAAGHRPHGDATLDRTHAHAQVAAHALGVDDLEMPLAVLRRADGLVRSVLAGDVAAAALDAQVLVDVRLVDVVEVQVLPVGDARHGLAHQFVYG